MDELELEDLLAELLPVVPDELPPYPYPYPDVVLDDGPVRVVLLLPPYEVIVLEPVTDWEVEEYGGGLYTMDDGPPPVVLWDTETEPVTEEGPPGGP